MTGTCTKLRLLLWKDWKLTVRHPCRLALLFIIPLVVELLIILILSMMNKAADIHFEDTSHNSTKPMEGSMMGPNSTMKADPLKVAWTSTGSGDIRDTARRVMSAFGDAGMEAMEFQTEEKLTSYIKEPKNMNTKEKNPITICGIIFENPSGADRFCAPKLLVTLRFPGKMRKLPVPWPTGTFFDTDSKPDSLSIDNDYISEHFLQIQASISSSIFRQCGDEVSTAAASQINVRQFPTPDHFEDVSSSEGFGGMLSFSLIISFLVPFISTVRLTTAEKEHQLKESMKIMGLPNHLHWAAWFIRTMILYLIIVIIILALYKINLGGTAVLDKSDITVVFVFFTLYAMASTLLSFLVSVLFNKVQLATIAAALIWLITYLPAQIMLLQKGISLVPKLIVSILSNSAVVAGLILIMEWEVKKAGSQWSNICMPLSAHDRLTLAHIFLMLLLDSVLYLIITLYIESIFPGSFGLPKKWYYIFQRDYWFRERKPDVEDVPIEEYGDNPENFEEEPKDLKVGVHIIHLRKVFPKRRVAVSDLSLKMYEGQVTVLLGHNGAGKSTTMNMLTGMYPPTSGVAILNGYDIAKDTNAARESISMCLQHNVLFDELTVREHLYFFAKLKGLRKENLRQEIDKYIALLDLEEKRNVKSKKLSGGMKRRLAIGIALCGKSKIVLLDEPTAGVDSAARHLFWNVIREEKPNRTILLTTHIMKEADVLGDRIAIMAYGRLLCSGSPFFLKQHFGSGYKLTIEKEPECDTEQVTRLLQNQIPSVTLLEDMKREMIYELSDKEIAKFEVMLRDLEMNRERLHVISFGLSASTMGDVFLNTVEEEEGTPLPKIQEIRETMEKQHLLDSEMHKGSKLRRDRLVAMCYKRQVVFKRSWVIYLIQCLVPTLFYLFAIGLLSLSQALKKSKADPPPLLLELKAYDQPVTTVVISSKIENATDEPSIFVRETYTNYKTIVQSTRNELNDLGYQDDPSPTFENFILKKLKEDKTKNYRKFIIAASFEQNDYTGWYTNYALHSIAISYNLLVNALMTRIPMSLDIKNSPLPLTEKTGKSDEDKKLSAVTLSLTLSLGILCGIVAILPSRERLCKSKHLQFVSGVGGETFWGVHFIWCFISFVPPFILYIAVVAMYQDASYSTAPEIGRLFLLLLLFAWAIIPITYFVTFWFHDTTSACITMVFFVPLCGFAQMFVSSLLNSEEGWKRTLYNIFFILPPFCFFDALSQMDQNNGNLEQCKDKREACPYLEEDPCCPGKCTRGCIEYADNYFQMKEPGIGKHVLFLIIPTLFYFCILVFIEYKQVFACKKKEPPRNEKKEKEKEEIKEKKKKKEKRKKNKNKGVSDEEKPKHEENPDADVLEEKNIILSYNVDQLNEKYTLCLRNITKYYHKFLAVDHVCVGIEKGECFGLLGANGAGKTTTFKIMTGDMLKYYGDAFIHGTSINNPRKVFGRIRIGYCPQFDALINNMTGRETLSMYCQLRGIPRESIDSSIKGMADVLLLQKFLDKKVKTYSGGTKRKLSTAVAVVGNPDLVFLDEPTAGMDPVARKCVWGVLTAVRDSGTSIVFTSHSMDECEAICTKIVIMVNGQFKCLGSLQHLKNKFTQGFILQIKVSTDRRETKDSLADSVKAVKSHISSIFPGATLRDEFSNLLVYQIPKENIEYSTMFGLMEKARKELNIEDYTLTQTDLEEVFLTFIKHQAPGKE